MRLRVRVRVRVDLPVVAVGIVPRHIVPSPRMQGKSKSKSTYWGLG